MNKTDEYKSIEELLSILEDIRALGGGTLNIPKALYTITKEIHAINKKLKEKKYETM